MATLANLVVRITGNTAQLNKAVDKAETRMSKFRKGASKALKAVGTAAKGLAIGGAIALTGFAVGAVKSFLDTGEALDKMSKRTGFSVEALGELKFAAEQSGTSIETIEKASFKLSGVLLDAENGLVGAKDALAQLGLKAEDLKALSPEEQFQTIANALSGVESASDKAALAQDLFGKSGAALLPLFGEGEEGMAALRAQAQSLGIVMSTEAAAGAASFNDSLNEVKSAALGVFKGFATALLPKLAEFARWLVSKKPEIQAFFNGIKEAAAPFFEAFKVGVATVWPILQSFFQFIFANKPILIAAMVALGAAIVLALGPVSLAVAAIVGIVTLIGFLRDNWTAIWGEIKSIWDTVSGAIVGIYDSYWGWILPAGPLVKAVLFVLDNWRAIWNTIKGIWGTVSGAIVGVYESKWGWILPAGPLVKAILFLLDNWRRVWNTIGSIWDTVSQAIRTTYNSLIAPIFGAEGLLGVAIRAVGVAWETVWGTVQTIWETVAQAVKEVYDTVIAPIFGVEGLLDVAIRAVMDTVFLFNDVWVLVFDNVRKVIRNVQKVVGEVTEKIKEAFQGVEGALGFLSVAFSQIFGHITTVVQTAKSNVLPIVAQIKGAIQGIIGVVDRALGAISSLKSVAGTIGGIIGVLPGLAEGGDVIRGGSAVVGEDGPELVKLRAGAQVTPLDGSGGGSGGGMTIIFQGPVYGMDDFDEKVNQARLRFRRAGN